MRLLFAHDHRFLRGTDGGLFTVGSFPASVWRRYLRHFDSVHVIARDGGMLPHEANLASTTHPTVQIEFVANLGSLRNLLRTPERVRRQIATAVRNADAVVARLPSEIGLRAVAEARAVGKPYLVEVVGCAFDSYYNRGSAAARLYAPLAMWRTRRAVADAPLALYVTSSWLQERYPSSAKWVAASNVTIAPMTADEHAARANRLRELAQGRPPHLGTVASLRTRSKGLQTAIPAIANLRRAGLELRYSILGAGDQAPWRELAQRHGVADLVSFAGTRPSGTPVLQWLDGIDLHLQPSFQEGLPRATIEAMSRGVACIGSTCGGIPELLPVERTHKPGDVEGLADRIRSLVSDPTAVTDAANADLARSSEFDPELLEARRDQIYGALRMLAEASAERLAA
jgi:glycosyltransferase involved in cell wall biosynthesis